MDDVGLDRAKRLVLNQNKDLLLFIQADEVTEPGPLSQSANKGGIDLGQISPVSHISHIMNPNQPVHKMNSGCIIFNWPIMTDIVFIQSH